MVSVSSARNGKKVSILLAALIQIDGLVFEHGGALRRMKIDSSRGVEEYETVECKGDKKFEGVHGTLYRAGACDENGNGAICAITLDGSDTILARLRYVRTKRYVKSLEEGPRAVGCFYWANRFFATQDTSQPYQIDPLSLGTQKLSDLGGQAEDRFDPWVKIHGEKGLVNAKVKRRPFALLGGSGAAELEIDEFNAKFKRIARSSIALGDGISEVSDWLPYGEKSFLVLGGTKGAKSQRLLVVRKDQADNPDGAPAQVLQSIEVPFMHHAGTAIIHASFMEDKTLSVYILADGELSRLVVSQDAKLIENTHLASADYVLPTTENDFLIVRDSTISLLSKKEQAWTSPIKNARIGLPSIIGKNDNEVLTFVAHPDQTELMLFHLDNLKQGPLASVILPSDLPADTHLRGPFVSDLTPSLDDLKKAETLTRLYAKKAREWNEIEGGFSGLGIKTFLFPKGVSGG